MTDQPDYPPDWADEPSDETCPCGARAVIVWPQFGPPVLACSDSGFSCTKCPAAGSVTE